MDLQKDKYIIVEIIPTHSDKEQGFIAQISALKLEGIKLLDRFDYRVEDRFIENDDLRNVIQYDKKNFTYVNNIYFIIEYTPKYLEEIRNDKEIIYPYLHLDYSNDVFNKIMDKYKLKPSNHLVDLLYEAVIYEGNNK